MEKLPQRLKSLLREKTTSIVSDMNSVNGPAKSNLHLLDQVLEKGTKLVVGQSQHIIKQNSALVFADHAPLMNWAHPCEYMFYDLDKGNLIDRVQAKFPPLDYIFKPELFESIARPVVFSKQKFSDLVAGITPRLDLFWPFLLGQRYAILYSGMSNNRHTNDLEFIYRTLIDVYGFNAKNIFVANYDGTVNYSGGPSPVGNWPGNNTPYRLKVDEPGTKAGLNKLIDKVAAKIKPNDFLFIHTNNHGGHDGTESNLCTYPSWDGYKASDFAAKLKSMPKFDSLMVMMEQCHSGGFITPILNNSPATKTHVAAACEELKNSIGGANFDPYALDWIAGVTGDYPDNASLKQAIDTTADGRISATEAAAYAKAVKDPFDTPMSSDKPAACGASMFLGRAIPVKASINWGNGKLYFFKGDKYYRFDWAADKVDAGYPKLIAGNWNGLWTTGIDASVNWGNGKAYFFKGSEYVRFDIAANAVDAGYPKPIAGNWPGLFTSDIDAAFNLGNGKAYFFKGAQYSRYDIAANSVDAGYPKPIAGNWGALWNDIDSVVMGNNNKIYFFKAGQYTRYDGTSKTVDAGYPLSVINNWNGLV